MITRIYIGSNNLSKVLEIEKIELVLNKYHQGYTIINASGYWKGLKEQSAIVEICDLLVSEDMLNELKKELSQDSLLITRTFSDNIFY